MLNRGKKGNKFPFSCLLLLKCWEFFELMIFNLNLLIVILSAQSSLVSQKIIQLYSSPK